jgi:hypothetical protein
VVAAALAAGLTYTLFLQPEPGADVAAYIEEVNETQAASATRYGSVQAAYRDFQLAPARMDEQLPRLEEAARALTSLRVRMERIPAPEDARVLRRRLIAFFEQQERVAHELVDVAEYLPHLGAAEPPVSRASNALRRELRNSSTPEAQEAALARYAAALAATAKTLDAVEPPALLAPAHDAYVKQLGSYSDAAAALKRAVASGDQDAVDRAVRRLGAAAAPSSQRAQRDAIEAYNRRVERIRTLAAAVERERRRLESDLA